MKRHANKIVITVCSLAFAFFVGCSDFAEGFREGYGNGPGNSTQPYHSSYNDNYWRNEWEIEKLKRIGREAAEDTARINANTRKMMYEMERQRKLNELKKQQREMQRRR
jgi:hypothetical protein